MDAGLPTVGLMGTPFTAAQMDRLRALTEAQGWAFLPLESGVTYPEDVLKDCRVLCGYFPKKLFKKAAQLQWYQLPCAGADRYVDETIYPHLDVTLTNASGAFGAAIAEQLVMGALILLRNMPVYLRQQRQHLWQKAGEVRLLGECRVVILGTGNLGGTFAKYCRAFGATCIGLSRSGTPTEHFDRVMPISVLEETVRDADIVACCLPLTEETRGLLDRRIFAAMPSHSIFLNVGRGKCVVQEDLMDALITENIYGAMLDVAEVEPMPADCPLWDMDRVILTPHISGSDGDAVNSGKIFEIFSENLRRYFSGQPLQNIVDRTKGY